MTNSANNLKNEVAATITLSDKALARITYNKLNAKGKVKVSFSVWYTNHVDALVDSWVNDDAIAAIKAA